jgi:hypothetical protein
MSAGTRKRWRALLALLVALPGAGCLDSSPVAFSAEAGATDAGREGSAGERCRTCMLAPEQPGPGCAAAVAPCFGDEKCWALVECTLAKGCLEYGSLNQRIECGLPCVEQLGIKSFNDPSVIRSIEIQQCSLETCRSACVVE